VHSFRNIIAQAKATGAYPARAVPLTMMDMIRLLEAALKYVPTGRGTAESCLQQL